MVQFKNVFTGQETRPYTRATTAQKCVRAGGKHNDLDNVGYTAAITRSSRCSATSRSATTSRSRRSAGVGARHQGLRPRSQAPARHHLPRRRGCLRLWKKVTGFADDRIIRIATSDNFWSMGDTGPCGPVLGDLLRPGRQDRGRPAGQRRRRTATASSSSGTSCSCSSSSAGPAIASTCPSPRSTPAWGSSACGRPAGHAVSLRDRPLQGADRGLGGGDRRAGQGRAPAPPTASSPTTCARRAS